MKQTCALPPGPKGLPLLGSILSLRRNQLDYLLHLQRTYGKMATVYIGTTPVVMLFRPEHVRYVLVECPDNFMNRDVAGGLVFGNLLILSLLAPQGTQKVADGMQEIVGESLISTDGPFHQLQRHLIQPAFAKKRVENYTDLIVTYTREAMGQWRTGKEMDVAQELHRLILRIIMKILVNSDLQTDDGDAFELATGMTSHPISIIEGLFNVRLNLPFTAYGRRLKARRRSDAFVDQLIEQHLASQEDVGDVLAMLLRSKGEHEETMSRQHIRDALATLIAAGSETSSNALVWTLYLLSQHPEALQKVVMELQTVLNGHDPKVGDLSRLTYLDWVIQESMRLYPSGWTQGRRAVEGFELDGYHIPAGTLLMFSQWVLHRLPDIWGDADTFRPERWDPLYEPKVQPWAYFPFGGGRRMCVGKSLAQLELRLILATILQQLIPHLSESRPVVPLPLITLRTKYGFWVRWESVQKAEVAPIRDEFSSEMVCPHLQRHPSKQ